MTSDITCNEEILKIRDHLFITKGHRGRDNFLLVYVGGWVVQKKPEPSIRNKKKAPNLGIQTSSSFVKI